MSMQERRSIVAAIHKKFRSLRSELDERALRLWAAGEARALGWGGISRVAEATGLSRTTIHQGLLEQKKPGRRPSVNRRVRTEGGGRRALSETDSELLGVLETIVNPTTRGDPMSPLRWTCMSTRKIAEALSSQGHDVSHRTVGKLLVELGYSLQSNRKTREGTKHPDRDGQFKYINKRVLAFSKRGDPVISVDTKKKELIGDFRNGGREWRPRGNPEAVRVHDFKDKKGGKVAPYGVYDVFRNDGWVSVGIDHDTAAFAVHSIKTWWLRMGSENYGGAKKLLITADSGGSNSARSRTWKHNLQSFADESGLAVSVCHLPPGTSKWNKIEHRMFCHITENWRGRPLVTREVVVNLIASTTTRKGLKIHAALDENKYPKGIKITDAELEKVNIRRDSFHGEWNYTILPRKGIDR